MRRWRLGLVTAVLLGLAGCKTPPQQIKPPRQPEEYVEPPDGDKRYDGPVEYPKGTLNQDRAAPKEFVPPGAPGSSGGPRSPGARLGGGGY
jgi:hypothetical protein